MWSVPSVEMTCNQFEFQMDQSSFIYQTTNHVELDHIDFVCFFEIWRCSLLSEWEGFLSTIATWRSAFRTPFSPFLGIEYALNASITGLDSLAIIRLPKTWICYWFCPAHWTWEWTWPPVHGDDAKAWRQRRHWSPERDIGLWRIDIVINIIAALFISAPLRFPHLSSKSRCCFVITKRVSFFFIIRLGDIV